ncbi:hypothetical protein [Cyclobacterium plantarum]|uniref:hypothetical protein n=1 Tax=Cyclobacterium plantarum TaxID=2716263 RepID=UPI003F729863
MIKTKNFDKVEVSSPEEIRSKLREVKHVQSIHYTHIWSLDGEHHVLTTHLVLENISEYGQKDTIRKQALEAVKEYDFSSLHHSSGIGS